MEVTVGFEPTNNAFAERTLEPLEYVTMVPQAGLEPARCHHHWILSPVRTANFATGACGTS